MYKKLFTLLILCVFIISLSAVSAGDSDLNTSVNNDVDYDLDNLGTAGAESTILNDDKIPSKITVISNTSGLKESDRFEFEVKLTDENDIPIAGKVNFYTNNELIQSRTSDSSGIVKFNTIKPSGFYYYQFQYAGDEQYSAYTSDIVELAFANDNTYTDLAMRVEFADDVLNVTKDYADYGNNIERRNLSDFNQILNSYKVNEGIPILRNITINGNNHTFNALSIADSRCFFKISDGCTLTVNEMTFINGYAYRNNCPMFHMGSRSVLNLYNVTLENLHSITDPIFYNIYTEFFSINIKDSRIINTSATGIGFMFPSFISGLVVEKCLFVNNSRIFLVDNWGYTTLSYNAFINCSDIISYRNGFTWDGYVGGNYWGTNDLDYINSNFVSPQEYLFFDEHSFLNISGNNNFSEDYDQDYDIYFSGKYADLLPAYSTVITYVSNCSTINATEINISSNSTTFRVSPKTYGNATLTVEPDLYTYNINITKSTKKDYNVTVTASEAEYSIPFNVTVNVRDVDGNPITTTANMTINGTSHTVNVDDGVGVLTLNDLNPGNYDIKTRILTTMEDYRNTTVYSPVAISKSTPVITIACNTTVTLAREDIAIVINTKNSKGGNVSALVFIEEDGVEIGNITTDNGEAIFHYSPEAGNHQYTAKTHDDFWELSQSNTIEMQVISKTPTKLSMLIDKNYVTEEGDYITIKVKLTDENDSPISKADINIIANDNIVYTNVTDNKGEIEFKFINSSNLYKIKAVYNGNLTYYDNFTETVNVIISTGGNFKDLAFLIDITDEDSTLNIIRNYTYDENVDSEFKMGIPITRNIKINGLNNTINGLNKSRIFNITADEVYIDNLNFINANSYTAAAIFFNGDSLYISNSNFENNMVFMSLESINYTIPDFYGGGAIYSNGRLYINNTGFYTNSLLAESDIMLGYTDTLGGGAIYSRGYLNVNNSVFDSNVLNKLGSSSYGLFASSIFAYSGSCVINNTIFNNSYSYDACVLSSVYNIEINISNSVFSNNWDYREVLSIRSPYSNIINSTFSNNHGRDGIISCLGECNITNSLFTNNNASTAGAIYMVQGVNLTLNQSVFMNNNATSAGAIYVDEGGILSAKYNIFVNNTADEANCIFLFSDIDFESFNDRSDYDCNYWGTNNPFDDKVFTSTMKKCDYITLEVIGDNVTYTTIPTAYTVKFNGTNSDKLPVFETQMTIEYNNGTLTNENITINSSGKEFTLTSDTIQNITVTIGPEYNNLTTYDITVKQLIRKNYTSDISVNNNIYGNFISIDVVVNDANGTGVNGTISYTFKDKTDNITITNGKTSIPLGILDAGEYNITINYTTPNLFYNNLTSNKSFEIQKTNTTFQLNVNNISYGEDEIIQITPQRGVTGNFTLYIENILNETVPIEMGDVKYTLKRPPAGNYTLTAIYNGDNNYNSTSLTGSFTVSKENSTISINVGKIAEGENVNIVFTVSEGATGNITYEIPGLYTPRNRTLSGVPVTWLISPLEHGTYTVNVYYGGDNNYYASSNSTIIDYRFKSTLNITAKDMGNKLRLIADLIGENAIPINGNVNVSVNGKSYNISVTNGTGYYDIERLAEGNYSYTATFTGNDKFSNTTVTGEFEVKTPEIILDIPDVTKYYMGSERLYVHVKDNNGNPLTDTVVFVTINNVKYNRTTNSNGTVSLPLNIPVGEYSITAYINTTDVYEGAGTVKIISTITASDIVKIFKNATKYSATFTDSKGNYLPEGTGVSFNINGVFYNRKVNNVGVASLNINLLDGEYILTANNTVTGELKSNLITVLPKIIENNNITKYYRNETQYTVKLLDDYGNPVGANEEVSFNINGVFYTRKTNSEGIAKLNINLLPGDYIITAEYADFKISNLIKVLSVLYANDLNKQYGTSNQFIATLLDGQGKIYLGQTVTFNINGVLYYRVTKDDGQARLNINLPAGEYIITSMYNDLSISNTVTITN